MIEAPVSPVVEVRHLRHVYPGGVEALRGVSFAVERGDVLGIIGRNGSGKTTTVKHFNGILQPATGEVVVLGEPTTGKKVAQLSRHVGYVFQNPDHQLFHATVEEEVNYGPRNLGMPEAERAEVVERVLTQLGLNSLRVKHPFELTKLHRKLVILACVLAMKPHVLVFDEPTTGQDRVQTRVVMDLLREFSREGHTLVIVSHDMSLIAEHCSRVLVLSAGAVLAQGTPGQIFSQPGMLAEAGLEPPLITQVAQRSRLGEPLLSVDQTLGDLGRRLKVAAAGGSSSQPGT
jgi:energy-coupling factor transport system ATP-binding protein